MSTINKELCQVAMRRTMAHRTGGVQNASAVAEATTRTFHQVSSILAPVIGTMGVYVLFRRSLHLTSKVSSWLLIAENQDDTAALLASLNACLKERDADEAAEVSCTIVVNFTELLTSLIGESLVDRLLDQVWASL